MLYNETRYLLRMPVRVIDDTSRQQRTASLRLEVLRAEVHRGMTELDAGDFVDVEEGDLESFMDSLLPNKTQLPPVGLVVETAKTCA